MVSVLVWIVLLAAYLAPGIILVMLAEDRRIAAAVLVIWCLMQVSLALLGKVLGKR